MDNEPVCFCLCVQRHTCCKIHDIEKRYMARGQETGLQTPPCDFGKSCSSRRLSFLIYRMKFLIMMCFSLHWSLSSSSHFLSFSTPHFPIAMINREYKLRIGEWTWKRHRRVYMIVCRALYEEVGEGLRFGYCKIHSFMHAFISLSIHFMSQSRATLWGLESRISPLNTRIPQS